MQKHPVTDRTYNHRCLKKNQLFGWLRVGGNFAVCQLCHKVFRLGGRVVIKKRVRRRAR